MKKNFSKLDLEPYMLVEKRDGSIGMILDEYIVVNEGYDEIDTWGDDLTDEVIGESEDIVAVSNVLRGHDLSPINWTKKNLSANLLWERAEVGEIDWSSNPLVECEAGYLTYRVRVARDVDAKFFAGVIITATDNFFGRYDDRFSKDSFTLIEE